MWARGGAARPIRILCLCAKLCGRAIKRRMATRFSARTLARGLCARRGFSTAPQFSYEPLFQTEGALPYPYRKLTGDYVSTTEVAGKKVLQVEPEALRLLSATAMTDIAHLLRPGHLQQNKPQKGKKT